MKILVLEDNERLCKLIASALVKESYKVDTFMDGEDALEALANGYNCFVLDINVPSLDGISILETIRMYHPKVPVIIISSNHELEKIQTSYEIGCDDYMKKPFFMYELIQKIKKLCNIELKTLDLSFGFVYDYKSNFLSSPEGNVKLAKKEILFLELLAKDINRVVSFEEIEEYIWEGEITTLMNIRALVKRFRKKLPENAILIVKGIGYSLNSQQCKLTK
ncbi:MAG: DNA-binding response OmpR family regulator [Sulfurimonas sp.]|jgi:DNA-binding response OmpR family regulator